TRAGTEPGGRTRYPPASYVPCALAVPAPCRGKVAVDGHAPDPCVPLRLPAPPVSAAHEQRADARHAGQGPGAPGHRLPGPAPAPPTPCALSPPSAAHWPLAAGRRDSLRPHRGLDHGVGHPLLLLYDVKASNGQKSKEFNDLGHYLSNTFLS